MRNLRLDIAYDGAGFYGWQKQPDKPTIQGLIEAAVERVTGIRSVVTGAGRTDAGVHATGQVANFVTTAPIPAGNLCRALNNILPPEIRIMKASDAPEGFHARRSASAKVYRYRILQAQICPPMMARFVCHFPAQLDVQGMAEAASWLEGVHDFTSFAGATQNAVAAGPKAGASAIRHIYHSRISPAKSLPMLTYEVRGSGFLYHMVRNIAGTLIEVGQGNFRPDDIPRILAAQDRSKAGPTAPAEGLCLVRVEYLKPGEQSP
ncbi:MAG: tRNA pseudouridine(38-40) synthase TruA [Acidobacteriota bacterium]|nr:tRNA pseudouridine(38-40) synthase TruA [Acidobacteriota bacterium]